MFYSEEKIFPNAKHKPKGSSISEMEWKGCIRGFCWCVGFYFSVDGKSLKQHLIFMFKKSETFFIQEKFSPSWPLARFVPCELKYFFIILLLQIFCPTLNIFLVFHVDTTSAPALSIKVHSC